MATKEQGEKPQLQKILIKPPLKGLNIHDNPLDLHYSFASELINFLPPTTYLVVRPGIQVLGELEGIPYGIYSFSTGARKIYGSGIFHILPMIQDPSYSYILIKLKNLDGKVRMYQISVNKDTIQQTEIDEVIADGYCSDHAMYNVTMYFTDGNQNATAYLYNPRALMKQMAWKGPVHTIYDLQNITDIENITVYNDHFFANSAENLNLFYIKADAIDIDTLDRKNMIERWFTPTATGVINLSGVLQRGGKIMKIFTMSANQHQEISSYLCIITTLGEMLVYQGTDPADVTKWALRGDFFIPVPINKRCFAEVEGDMIVVTESGFLSLQRVVMGTNTQITEALEWRLSNLFNKYEFRVSAYKKLMFLTYFAKKRLLIFNVPHDMPTTLPDIQIGYTIDATKALYITNTYFTDAFTENNLINFIRSYIYRQFVNYNFNIVFDGVNTQGFKVTVNTTVSYPADWSGTIGDTDFAFTLTEGGDPRPLVGWRHTNPVANPDIGVIKFHTNNMEWGYIPSTDPKVKEGTWIPPVVTMVPPTTPGYSLQWLGGHHTIIIDNTPIECNTFTFNLINDQIHEVSDVYAISHVMQGVFNTRTLGVIAKSGSHLNENSISIESVENTTMMLVNKGEQKLDILYLQDLDTQADYYGLFHMRPTGPRQPSILTSQPNNLYGFDYYNYPAAFWAQLYPRNSNEKYGEYFSPRCIWTGSGVEENSIWALLVIAKDKAVTPTHPWTMFTRVSQFIWAYDHPGDTDPNRFNIRIRCVSTYEFRIVSFRDEGLFTTSYQSGAWTNDQARGNWRENGNMWNTVLANIQVFGKVEYIFETLTGVNVQNTQVLFSTSFVTAYPHVEGYIYTPIVDQKFWVDSVPAGKYTAVFNVKVQTPGAGLNYIPNKTHTYITDFTRIDALSADYLLYATKTQEFSHSVAYDIPYSEGGVVNTHKKALYDMCVSLNNYYDTLYHPVQTETTEANQININQGEWILWFLKVINSADPMVIPKLPRTHVDPSLIPIVNKCAITGPFHSTQYVFDTHYATWAQWEEIDMVDAVEHENELYFVRVYTAPPPTPPPTPNAVDPFGANQTQLCKFNYDLDGDMTDSETKIPVAIECAYKGGHTDFNVPHLKKQYKIAGLYGSKPAFWNAAASESPIAFAYSLDFVEQTDIYYPYYKYSPPLNSVHRMIKDLCGHPLEIAIELDKLGILKPLKDMTYLERSKYNRIYATMANQVAYIELALICNPATRISIGAKMSVAKHSIYIYGYEIFFEEVNP